MTSVELGEQLETARKYCDEGELSRFLRLLIQKHDEEQNLIPINHNRKKNVFILQTITYLTIGITFLILAVSQLTGIIVASSSIFLVLCGFFLFGYVYMNIKQYKNVNGVNK